MVCSKCQKILKKTDLATPSVKRKNENYLGSPTVSGLTHGSSRAATCGVSKNKLLSKGAKNPYAAYSSTCETCNAKIESGRKYCQRCAYRKNACPMCGKDLAGPPNGKKDETILVQGRKFSSK